MLYALSIVYVLPYFLYRTSSPLPAFGLHAVMLPIELFVIYIVFTLESFNELSSPESGCRRVKYLLGLVTILLVLFVHSIGMYISYEDGNADSQMLNLVRLSVYLFATAIFAKFYFDFRVFQQVLFGFSLWFSLGTLGSYYLNPTWFVDVGYGTPRPRFLFSEPSALAPIVTFLFFMSLLKKHLLGGLTALLLIFHLASGVVSLVFLSTLVAVLLTIKKRLLIFLGVPLLIIGIAYMLPMMEESYLYTRLSNAVINTDIEEMTGGTARLITLFNLGGELLQDDRLFFGRGFNTAKAFYGNQWEFREFGLVHFYLFSFGFVGLLGMLGIVLFVIHRIYKQKNTEFLIMFLPFVMASLLNSAQGSVLHKFAYLFVLVVFLKPNELKRSDLSSKLELVSDRKC